MSASIAFIVHFLLVVAFIGLLSSTVFLILSLIGTAKFRREAGAQRHFAEQISKWPPVSILIPVHGTESRLRENLESFFHQDYPEYEILFAADEEDDPALAIVRDVAARNPTARCRIFVTGKPELFSPNAYCYHRLTQVAAHAVLVDSESDIEVTPNYLREVVAPVLDPGVGMVTCVYRGKNAGGFWSGLDAIGMSVEMTAGVLTANLLEGMKFGLGGTIVTRKDVLEKIGGHWATGGFLGNDFALGTFMVKAGYRVLLSGHVVEHIAPLMTFRRMWDRQVRWAKGTRWCRPWGHLGTGLIFATPYGVLGLLAGISGGQVAWGVGLFLAAAANRLIEAWTIGWGVVRDPRARSRVWLYPARDLLGFAAWLASYMSNRVFWRNHRYELVKGGRIAVRQNTAES
jgi:ceramide glucosyltransferase